MLRESATKFTFFCKAKLWIFRRSSFCRFDQFGVSLIVIGHRWIDGISPNQFWSQLIGINMKCRCWEAWAQLLVQIPYEAAFTSTHTPKHKDGERSCFWHRLTLQAQNLCFRLFQDQLLLLLAAFVTAQATIDLNQLTIDCWGAQVLNPLHHSLILQRIPPPSLPICCAGSKRKDQCQIWNEETTKHDRQKPARARMPVSESWKAQCKIQKYQHTSFGKHKKRKCPFVSCSWYTRFGTSGVSACLLPEAATSQQVFGLKIHGAPWRPLTATVYKLSYDSLSQTRWVRREIGYEKSPKLGQQNFNHMVGCGNSNFIRCRHAGRPHLYRSQGELSAGV